MTHMKLSLIILIWMMTGCANKQMAGSIDFSDGCHFRMEGITIEQAARLEREWKLESPCGVEIRSGAN